MATIHVASGGNLQNALNTAVGGDTITLAAGATFSGNFTVPVHTGTGVVTVRSDAADGSLPAAGTRMQPSYAALLPKLRGQQLSNWRQVPVLKFALGAKNWLFMFIEVDSNYWGAGELISIGVNDLTQTEWTQQPENITFDRNYIHGNRLWGQKRGIGFHGKNITIVNNWFERFGSNGQDSQCMAGGNGEGPITVLNNRLEGGTENFILGGDRSKISTITSVVSITSSSAFRLASTARLKIGLHMYFKISDTVRGQWTYCTSFNPATGDVTVSPPLTATPAVPGEVQWGAIMHTITFRRNHCIKPIIEMTEGVIHAPTGLAGTTGSGGILAAGTYLYQVQGRNPFGYEGNPVQSNASTSISKTVGASGLVNLSWTGTNDASYYRVYRQSPGGAWDYKDTSGVALTMQDNGSGWTSTVAPTGGSKRVHKNLFEFKSGVGWQIDSNIFENHWRGSDVGIAIWMKSNSQEGKEPFNHADDIVFEKNVLRHVFGFFSVSGRITSVGFPAYTLPDAITNVKIRQNLVFDSSETPYGQGNTQYSHAVQNGASGVVIDHNTIISAMKGTGFFNTNTNNGLLPGLTYKNNFMLKGTYGLRGQSSISTAEGTVSLNAYTSGNYSFTRNVLANASASIYPSDNEFPAQATLEAHFVNYGGSNITDYALTSTSRYRVGWLGTDGKPIGVDITALAAAVSGVDAGDPEVIVNPPVTGQAYVITGSGGIRMGGSAVIQGNVTDPAPDPDPGPGPDPSPETGTLFMSDGGDDGLALSQWDVVAANIFFGVGGVGGTLGIGSTTAPYSSPWLVARVAPLPSDTIIFRWSQWIPVGSMPFTGFSVYVVGGIYYSAGGAFTFANRQVSFNTTPDGKFYFTRGSYTGPTIAGPTTDPVWVEGEWNDIEIQIRVSHTEGYIILKKNGNVVLIDSGLDTQALTVAQVDGVEIVPQSIAGSSTALIDNIWIGDLTADDPFPVIPPYVPPAGSGAVSLGVNTVNGANLCGGENPMAFVTWKGNGYSNVQINDPDGYYFGPKPPIVKAFGSVERALSGIDGQFETSSATITFADASRDIRQALGLTGGIRNALIDYYMYSDTTRRAQGVARRLFQGVIKNVSADSPLTVSFSVEDWFGSQFCAFDVDKKAPVDLILPSYFTGAPLDVYGLPEPLGYGLLSDELPAPSTTAAPTIIDTGRGFITVGGVKQVGFGENDTLAGPIATALAVSAASGGTIPAGEWGVMITSVDDTGRESDPYPFTYDTATGWAPGIPTITVSGSQKIVATFAHDATVDPRAVYLRVYLGFYYFGARWTQFIQVPVSASSCEFTTAPIPPTGVEGTLDTVTPGAIPVTYSSSAWYYVTAVMPDGETVGSARAFHIQRGYRRFNWIEWTPVVGALSYRVYKSALQTSDPYARWDLPATQTVLQDDMMGTGSKPYVVPVPVGVVKTRYVGDFILNDGQTWQGLLICRGCASGIVSWFASDTADTPSRIRMPETTEGVDFLVPGRLGWNAVVGPQKYIDINDRRYTMMFVRGPRGTATADGTVPVTVNMYGYEEIGDGLGLYIDDLPRQYLHFLTNFVIQKTTLLWQPIPLNAYGYSVIDGQSFEAAKTYYDTITGGRGLKGAWQLGWEAQEQLGTVIAQLNQSTDAELLVNANGQLAIDVLDTEKIPLDTVTLNDTLFDSLKIHDDDSEFFDEISYHYAKTYADSVTAITPAEDTPLPRELTDKTDWQSGLVGFYGPIAIGLLGEVRTLAIDFFMLRDQASADMIARRKLARYGIPPTKVEFDMDLCGLNYELGDIIALTHFAGLSSTGWTTKKLRLERQRVDIDNLKTSLECRVVDFVYDSV